MPWEECSVMDERLQTDRSAGQTLHTSPAPAGCACQFSQGKADDVCPKRDPQNFSVARLSSLCC